MIKRGLVVIILLLLNIAIAISVDYPTHSTLYTNEIKPVSNPPAGSGITASTIVTINAAGKITRFNYNGDYLDVDLGKFIVKSDGKVGIGTTSPTAPLDVVGPPTGNGITIRASGGGDVVLNPGGSLFFDGVYSYGGGNYIRPVALNTQTFVTSGAERMRITSVGNIGIGTTAPTQKLDVVGNVQGTALCINGDCKTAWPSGGTSQWTTSGSSSIYYAGNVGIGTASPYGALHVNGPYGAGSWTYFDGNAGGAATPNALFKTGLAMAWNPSNGEGESVIAYGTGAGVGPRLDFASWNGATLSKVMTLGSNGNVGIGTMYPQYKLEVIGNIRTSGDITAGSIYAPNLAGGIITASGNIGAQGDIAANGKVKATNIGTTFTRWGRNDCPSLTTLVYDGYVAGSHAGHGGSGKNTLCLSKTPLWLNYNDADNNGNLLYGTEFQTNDGGLSTTMGYLQDYEAQCAVCLVNDATMTLMVPGTYACPSGWTKQYYGYLMATHYTQGGSETVCVDYAAQGFISNANNDQSLWYSTEAECGSLPCPPYVQNREVTCVVCTK